MKILITGGAGYIGSTIASACLDAGIEPVILDDLSKGIAAHTVGRIFFDGDIADGGLLDRILDEHPEVFAVIHCAARTVVPESVADPLGYYDVNVGRTVRMLQHLRRRGVRRIVFSSSASVYAGDLVGGLHESAPLAPASPYARTKADVERILSDTAASGDLRTLSLRYFNPIGCDPRLRTGPTSPRPSHVLGLLLAARREDRDFTITGVDWPTRDGSGLRDFVHVWDLARAHVAAVEHFDEIVTDEVPAVVLNVGTGRGTTVRELVDAFVAIAGPLPVNEGTRRPGDVAGGFALVDAAEHALRWRAELSIDDAIRDALAWEDRAASETEAQR
ncbi:UDP-glucose 4-epimerase GalE [Microbacterium sp. NPDC055910]|uniref:UDP-glucose 4-epimerase GalE n=1 Tax=Microbacterium sp. NPDC055910 TaxID=3345659 RepID=UPI0035D71310